MRRFVSGRHALLALTWIGLVGFGLPRSAEARGRIPIVIVWGQGEEIVHVQDLEPSIRQEVSRALGHDVAVGYHYKRVHLFWLSAWTWDGKHVLFHGDQYWTPPSESDWKDLVGAGGLSSLGKPIWYRFPAGLSLLGLLIGGTITMGIVFPSDAKKAEKLMKQEHYQEAARVFFEKAAVPPRAPDAPPPDYEALYQKGFRAAVARLQDHGIPPDKAEANFGLIVRVMQERSAATA